MFFIKKLTCLVNIRYIIITEEVLASFDKSWFVQNWNLSRIHDATKCSNTTPSLYPLWCVPYTKNIRIQYFHFIILIVKKNACFELPLLEWCITIAHPMIFFKYFFCLRLLYLKSHNWNLKHVSIANVIDLLCSVCYVSDMKNVP